MTSSTVKKDIQKLQRAIVDGLEDVKAQDIVVFNTEHLSPLFERVLIASGNTNRQTKALAASVVDAVREAGFEKPRIEGEENAEWIIIDCGQAVVHVMQPAIRQYYHLEEIWGEKPVRLKFGAPKPQSVAKANQPVKPKKSASKRSSEVDGTSSLAIKNGVSTQALSPKEAAKSVAKKAPANGVRTSKTSPRATAGVKAKAPAAKTTVAKTPVKTPVKTRASSTPKSPTKTPTKTPAKSVNVKTVVVKPPKAMQRSVAEGKTVTGGAKRTRAPAKGTRATKTPHDYSDI